ncbi:nitrate- and nitrite sensing domain-containing protein [Streptomyces sp. ODS05-4]|uniref:sensor histidine kinase n=1 Tax=Streptomyces sp. ODS05-4 TaxID=2944939 RepID=UPI00210A05E7|nr:nitrate- and nitrite sensing domain-containing protein [Streptomyces sp. ODS05-4]
MAIVLSVPLLAALVLAGLRISDAVDAADTSRDLRDIAATARSGSALIRALADERDRAVDPRARHSASATAGARGRTDRDATVFSGKLDDLPAAAGMRRHRSAVVAALKRLRELRRAHDDGAPPSTVQSGYGAVILTVAGVHNQVGSAEGDLQSSGWTLYNLALDTAMLQGQRANLSLAVAKKDMSAGSRGNYLAAQLVRDTTGREFTYFADRSETARFDRIAGSAASRRIAAAASAVERADGGRSLVAGLPKGWYEAMTKVGEDLTRLQDDVERHVVRAAEEQRMQARHAVVTDCLVAAGILLAAMLVAHLSSRGLVRGLKRLSASASEVAEQRLPVVTRHLSNGTPLPAEWESGVLSVRSHEELGEVARAFNHVYLEAVRLGREQARLREEVNSAFRSLSWRNSNLVERQLTLISDLESEELDPAKLARLFRVDHLAVRIRRNSENLLVIAGADAGHRRTGDMDLVSVLRAAACAIESYERVAYGPVPEVELAGFATHDVVHLVSELLDNAVSFSSPATEVDVCGTRLPDGRLLLEVRDQGIGITGAELHRATMLLRGSRTSSVDAARTMGLHVVGVLARRHGVDVRLRSGAPAGTVAAVILPPGLLVEPPAAPAEWTGRPRPPHTPPAPEQPGKTPPPTSP